MKREIKFRVWSKSQRHMDVPTSITIDDSGHVEGVRGYGGEYPYNDIEIMQFTGLHDKNGREIYESDILRVTTGEDGESYVATVKWFDDEDYPAFDLEGIPAAWNYDANALATIFQSGVETCEVIGNIYEYGGLIGDTQ
ncbi:YopX family protein [Lapidilactobacillus mulanensis]|uniref:YopX family protein n=1 Tax=Lapidilactobacillus mulanensis TaxID=2485999 RepID=A0ABW4DSM4_9LACO|nr:YopX family protein [Lapidilactobacillus mulanensis]